MGTDIMFVNRATTDEQIEYHAARCSEGTMCWDRDELCRFIRQASRIFREGSRLRDYYLSYSQRIADGLGLSKDEENRRSLYDLSEEYWMVIKLEEN
jgi:triphosphoribosyl-dephospho-CoA synthetase